MEMFKRQDEEDERPGLSLFFPPFRHLILINLMCYANRASAIRHAHSNTSREGSGIGARGEGQADTPLPFGRSPTMRRGGDIHNGIDDRRRRSTKAAAVTDCDIR